MRVLIENARKSRANAWNFSQIDRKNAIVLCVYGRRGMQFYELKIAFGFLLHSLDWHMKESQMIIKKVFSRHALGTYIVNDSLLIINRNEMQTIDEADIS